jgi:tRNA (Thr-GGU) A37 N-methylase
MDGYQVIPIGWVRGGRPEVEDDGWGGVTARIELDPGVLHPIATLGLGDFSHVEIVYVFDRVAEADICRGARHPRGRSDWPEVGILAQRAKDRPNRIGITACELIEVDGLSLAVRGLDAVEGTPVVDIKPYMCELAPRPPVREPRWAAELMRDYW